VASQESLQQYKDLFRSRAHQLFLLGMGLLLALRILLLLMENNYTVEETEIQKPNNIADSFKPDSDGYKNYVKVHEMLQPMEDFRKSDYWMLASYNMFDPKRILEAKNYEEHADQIFGEAQSAFKTGNTTESLRLVNEALSYQPNHAFAQRLRLNILKMMGLSEDKTSTSTQSTGVPSTPPGPPALR
jgi:hypothetical protein